MRRILELLVGIIVVMIAAHTFVLMGLMVPVQVAAGSMAPHWLGPHWALSCGDCGARYEVGADAPPQVGRTVCPVCDATVLIGHAPRRDGDSLLVDRAAYNFRAPRRWEAVVFRCPTDARRLCVKRVIGLPGEWVSLVDGDVYVNGQVARKSLGEQRTLRVLVYRIGRSPSRWQPAAESSSWLFHAGAAPYFEFNEGNQPFRNRPLDLLAYISPNGEPVSDSLPYNAGVPALTNPKADLMLTGALSVRGSGTLHVRCGEGESALWVELDSADRVLRLRQAERIVREADCPQLGDAHRVGRALGLELSLFDRQVIVAVDGGVCVQYRLQEAMPLAAKPFAIAARNLQVRIKDLTVWRDVVYTPRPGGSVVADATQGTWQLAADEYFVLGDNPAISDDSRTWRGGPGLPARLIIGRALGGR